MEDTTVNKTPNPKLQTDPPLSPINQLILYIC